MSSNTTTDPPHRRPNNSGEIKEHIQSEQVSSQIILNSSLFAFSKPILPATSSLLPPKIHLSPPLLNGSITFGSASDNPIPEPISPNTTYRECLRNHAASLGGHVIDGCCEFMPLGFADPFKCMACGCHRSFHRKQLKSTHNAIEFQSSSGERVEIETSAIGKGGRRKRFRTKFSEEQKEKMRAFAERVGWRVQKKDDGEINELCKGLEISRQVLRVWMHNNKHLVLKKFSGEKDECYERREVKVEKVMLCQQR